MYLNPDPNLHNPAFVHGMEAMMLFTLAACIVGCYFEWKAV